MPARVEMLDLTRVLHHEHDDGVEGQIAQDQGEQLGAGEGAAGGEAAVALAGAEGDGVNVDGGGAQGLVWPAEVRDDGDRPVPARAAERRDEVVGPAEAGQEGRGCRI